MVPSIYHRVGFYTEVLQFKKKVDQPLYNM